jgi:Amt family ammonium transporter
MSTDTITLSSLAAAIDVAWVITSSSFVVMMQLGFAMLEAGTVNEHNVIATYAKNLLDFLIGTVVAAAWGYALATGEHPLGSAFSEGEQHTSFFFYLCFQATAATIVSGAMAERTSVLAYLSLSVLLCGGVYSMAVRLAWSSDGWLQQLDPPLIDFAGSGVVHLVGGVAALVGAAVVGPRARRWEAAHASRFVPHNVPSVLGGVMLLWVGWCRRLPSEHRRTMMMVALR